MFSEENPRRLAQIALIALLIVGCVAVLLPMVGAILFAFVLWICTWTLYSEKLLPRIGGRKSLGAALMTTLLVLLILVPMIFLVASLANSADFLVEEIRPRIEQGLPAEPPAFLSSLPIFGSEIVSSWHRFAANKAELAGLLKQLIEPARNLALAVGAIAAFPAMDVVRQSPMPSTSVPASWVANSARK